MAVLTVEVPDELIVKIEDTGRSADEVVIKALERELDNGSATPQSKAGEPSREEVIRRWIESGFIVDPSEWANLDAKSWSELPEAEKQQHIKEMNDRYFPNSEISRFIHENRR